MLIPHHPLSFATATQVSEHEILADGGPTRLNVLSSYECVNDINDIVAGEFTSLHLLSNVIKIKLYRLLPFEIIRAPDVARVWFLAFSLHHE